MTFTCPPDHKHGQTSNCYSMHKCRCDECREVRAKQHQAYRRKARNGHIQEYVDAGPIAQHIRRLVRDGWEYADIAKVSGVSEPTIGRVRRGVTKRVETETADAILGTLPRMRDRANPSRMVNAVGVRRRIRALVAVGWTVREIARRVGKTPSQMWWYERQDMVTVATHAMVAAVYDEMWAETPPQATAEQRRIYKRARTHAANRGWPSPLAWDDDRIDDPLAIPDTDGIKELADADLIDAALNGEKPKLTPAQRREVITILNERRWPAWRIGEHIGCATDTVHRIRNQLDLPVYLANGTHYKDGTLAA